MNYFDVLFAKKQSGGGGTPTLITKSITENGTYSASEDSADGYSQVTVNVPYMEKKSASGDIASFSDGAGYPFLKVKANINPVQDLHGYDYPWVGGANLNLLRPGEANTYTSNGITFTSDGSGKYTIKGTATAGVNCTFDCEEYTTPDGSNTTLMFMNTATNPNVAFEFYRDTTLVDNWSLSVTNRMQCPFSALSQKTINKYNIFVAAGSTVDMTISPMFIAGDVTANPPSFRPYSNICPISGFTGVNVAVTGANVWDEEWESGYYFTGSSGKVVKAASATTIRSKNPIPILPNTTYRIAGNVYKYFFTDEDANVISDGTNINITTPSKACYLYFYCENVSTYNNDISINYPSTDTSYHAYNGHVYPISWQNEAGIVYGGYIDLVSGVLTVTKVNVNMQTLSWTYSSNYSVFLVTVNNLKFISGSNDNIKCSVYRNSNVQTSSSPDFTIYTREAPGIGIKDSRYTDATAFKTMLQENNAQLVYELIEPLVYQLTPQQINTLISQNNAWNNTNGQTEVEYFIPIE